MVQFIKTLCFLCLVAYGVKTATNVITEKMADPETQEKLQAVMKTMDSVNNTITIRGETIEVNEDTDLLELYKCAKKEAGFMMKTGDFSVYEDQLDQNKEFLDLIKKMEQEQIDKQNASDN